MNLGIELTIVGQRIMGQIDHHIWKGHMGPGSTCVPLTPCKSDDTQKPEISSQSREVPTVLMQSFYYHRD